jgi:hypothetical protein
LLGVAASIPLLYKRKTPEELAAFRRPRSKVTIIASANIKAEQKALDISKSPRSAIQHAVTSA